MCFTITRNALRSPPPVQRIAYKVVDRDRRSYFSSNPVVYHDGAEVLAEIRSNGAIVRRIGWSSQAGIYVYRTLKSARSFHGTRPFLYIIKVRVRPDDFIASGKDSMGRLVATYSKVTVIGRVK